MQQIKLSVYLDFWNPTFTFNATILRVTVILYDNYSRPECIGTVEEVSVNEVTLF